MREYEVNGKRYCFNSPYEIFDRKGYGAILVQKEEDIEKVKDIIRQMDEDEYEHYFNEKMIMVYNKDIEAEYNGKFELNVIDLALICIDQGIFISIINGSFNRW